MSKFEKCYKIQLSDGQQWQVLGTSEVQPWLDRLASILGLKASPLNGFPKAIFLRINSDREREDLFNNGWEVHNLGGIWFWSHPDKPDKICEISNDEGEVINIVRMWLALFPFYQRALEEGGLPLHAGLIQKDKRGFLLAAAGGVGKSTCCRRIPYPWKAICDDEVLITLAEQSKYYVHPFPTWSEYIRHRSERTWDVEQFMPLSAIFFLERADKDGIVPIGQGELTIKIAQSATQVFQKHWWKLGEGKKCAIRKKLFVNSCELAKKIPAYLLRVSLDGKFWNEIEKVSD